jgi:hypothetical protein
MGVRAKRALRTFVFALAGLVVTSGPLTACGPSHGRPAVSLRMKHSPKTPRDASVIIDEQYIGPLGMVAARGVRLPIGEHRITVQKPGYFPWDKLVEADRYPITLDVELVPVPD